jgi:hypothetical protein
MNKSKKIKNMMRIILLALISVIFSGHAYSQASVTAQMFAEVVEALTATENSQLSFGRFTPETNGGEIRLTPDGIRFVNGNVILSGGGHSAGSFIITGEDKATYSITLPTSQAVLTSVNGSKEMLVTDWESIPAAGIGVGGLNGGSQEVKVGATLKVGSMTDNPKGIYTGTYFITFSYN